MRVGDLRQVASVRRIVLDDGAERGVRALSFSTGGGLDFWVLTDRSMDIGTLSWQGVQLAWQTAAGFRAPALINPEDDGGRGFNRGFGGFLITCGLNHIRQPMNGEPLHGRLPFTPARLTGYGEEWERAEPTLFCEGEVVQSRYGGETLRLKRRIEAPIGGASMRILDTVENLGAEQVPQAILYHFNLGFPAIASGSTIELNGDRLLGPTELPDGGLMPARTWPTGGEGEARCVVKSPSNAGAAGLAVTFAFDTRTLGHLQVWHDLRKHAGVLSIEPCSSPFPEKGDGPPEALAPGERREYRLEVSLAGTPATAFAPNCQVVEKADGFLPNQ
ncbi:DUF4432 family protein [Chelativorans xinjiangense]|uniref:DUF4432 family protein n=1 Tax=Chelativorans xinjiangense TaxID=2681485 RepID=UPI00135A8E45|nr:DUF4432 family protein [Chelativorans xinjiangense]